MNKKTLQELRKIVGQDQVTTVPEELACYSYDGTGQEYLPAAVVFPGSTEEICRIMQLASATPFTVVPRGAGTGMTGGALPVAGGLVMVMSRLNRILEIDRDNQIAILQPGVITGDLRKAAGRHGLYYPPDPASLKFCTMGGNVAECAGGPSAVKYGVTRDYVLGLEAVLPDGRLIHTGVRTAKGVVGYDLTRLLVGSEGTLAIITQITVRLLPAPEARSILLVLCRGMVEATSLVAGILAHHTPCTLEYMDRTALAIVQNKLPFPLPEEVGALLLIELDGQKDSVALATSQLTKFLQAQPGIIQSRTAESADEAEQLWAARRAISPAAFSLKPHKMSEDVVVPRSHLPQLVSCTEALHRELGVVIFTFGHAGDGNIHVNIMLDRSIPQEVRQANTAKQLLFEEVLRLGGTLSGEHGIGLTKAAYLAMELDQSTITLMQEIKRLFDPLNILNPGKIFPPPIDSEKH
ncbi:MAG TPA: glycolate oxidase subunit GlcD [Desulfobulbaceae bacterium]|nr:MAG: glycolate oxidase subunit GlcD [Deltaproteobacteria bacterium RIFOXYD12_FULL_53_23]HCC54419.1 glycolate oxidase subunit GlcD [Desulfobulbaceae bacterium]